jgi:hypothetical protein
LQKGARNVVKILAWLACQIYTHTKLAAAAAAAAALKNMPGQAVSMSSHSAREACHLAKNSLQLSLVITTACLLFATSPPHFIVHAASNTFVGCMLR